MNKLKKLFGPSTLVTAAFIGPGTLTVCTMAGVKTGYEMLWVMLFAIAATVVLQEMAARLGYATQKGLGEALSSQFSKGLARYLLFFLVIGAILVGNAAYEAGNISGGVLGLELLAGEFRWWPLILGGLSFVLLYLGRYQLVERILIGMVILMSICFLLTAILVKPDLGALFSGLIPSAGSFSKMLLIAALVGTTIVPYNLFLHAATVSKKWSKDSSLKALRLENLVAVGLGGLISILIIITAAGSQGNVESVESAKDLAVQLEPLFGQSAKWFMGLGLMAAGVSSALTAPLAAAYAAKGLFGWTGDERDGRFRAVWILVLVIGIVVSITDVKRVLIIQFAQVTNAILLPCVAVYLLYSANSKKRMGEHANGLVSNVLGGIVILLTLVLSLKSLNSIFHFI